MLHDWVGRWLSHAPRFIQKPFRLYSFFASAIVWAGIAQAQPGVALPAAGEVYLWDKTDGAYRVTGLTSEGANATVVAAKGYYDRSYDIFFRLDPNTIYCSELPFYAFEAAGIMLGRIERLGNLDIDTPEGRAIFLARWQDHPDCQADGSDRDSCWALIQDQPIVTPVSIAEDSSVELVFSTFGEAL